MYRKNWNFDTAFKYVRRKRRVAFPNLAFRTMLKDWDVGRKSKIKGRIYVIARHHATEDFDTLVPKLCRREELSPSKPPMEDSAITVDSADAVSICKDKKISLKNFNTNFHQSF